MRSFGFALEGLATLLRTQPNFVVHVAAACVALGLGIALRLGPLELALIILTIALVLVVESINTALETLCDLVSPRVHPLIKQAKNISAAAAVTVAVLLFGPRLLGLLR